MVDLSMSVKPNSFLFFLNIYWALLKTSGAHLTSGVGCFILLFLGDFEFA
jgi:hypothetical protein